MLSRVYLTRATFLPQSRIDQNHDSDVVRTSLFAIVERRKGGLIGLHCPDRQASAMSQLTTYEAVPRPRHHLPFL
jgi:hypothetical protein